MSTRKRKVSPFVVSLLPRTWELGPHPPDAACGASPPGRKDLPLPLQDRDQTHTLGLHPVKGGRMKPGFQKGRKGEKGAGRPEAEGATETA